MNDLPIAQGLRGPFPLSSMLSKATVHLIGEAKVTENKVAKQRHELVVPYHLPSSLMATSASLNVSALSPAVTISFSIYQ